MTIEENGQYNSEEDILGGKSANSIERILEICKTRRFGTDEYSVHDKADTTFTWNYDKGERTQLEKLYEKAKVSQWNVETDLDWTIDVDPYKIIEPMSGQPPCPEDFTDPGSALHHFGKKEWADLRVEMLNWRMSQFLHGEQGALLCTSKIVESVPWIDAKYYAATQVVDEARHVEVFSKYINTKIGQEYPVNSHLQMLLDEVLQDSRWDMTYLGMQIMIEGLALAAFGFLRRLTEEPLLKKLLKYVMADEARHVAFGVISLKEYYTGLSTSELRERQEFAFEAAVRMRDRFMAQEVWEKLGIPVRPMVEYFLNVPPEQAIFQQMLFSRIVPNCKKLGLLDAGDGWLRDRFTDIGVIQFEDEPDTEEMVFSMDGEYELDKEEIEEYPLADLHKMPEAGN